MQHSALPTADIPTREELSNQVLEGAERSVLPRGAGPGVPSPVRPEWPIAMIPTGVPDTSVSAIVIEPAATRVVVAGALGRSPLTVRLRLEGGEGVFDDLISVNSCAASHPFLELGVGSDDLKRATSDSSAARFPLPVRVGVVTTRPALFEQREDPLPAPRPLSRAVDQDDRVHAALKALGKRVSKSSTLAHVGVTAMRHICTSDGNWSTHAWPCSSPK